MFIAICTLQSRSIRWAQRVAYMKEMKNVIHPGKMDHLEFQNVDGKTVLNLSKPSGYYI
jgi:hypothetical protein